MHNRIAERMPTRITRGQQIERAQRDYAFGWAVLRMFGPHDQVPYGKKLIQLVDKEEMQLRALRVPYKEWMGAASE